MSKEALTAVLAILVVLTGVAAWWPRPAPESFREDRAGQFIARKDVLPLEVERIAISSLDADAGQIEKIVVRQEDQQWYIASRFDYPADGPAEGDKGSQVAQALVAATSLTYGRLVTDDAVEHANLGVRNPNDYEPGDTEDAFGVHVELIDKQGQDVLDLIIGNEASELSTQTYKYYYVRHPDQAAVYLGKYEGFKDKPDAQWVDTNVMAMLSTDFKDWVEPDLMKLERDQVRRLTIDEHSVDFSQGARLIQGPTTVLVRASSDTDWRSQQLPEGQEIAKDAVNKVTGALDALRIKDVTKPTADLSSYGFYRTKEDVLVDVGQAGSTGVTTSQGFAFDLYFGITTGSGVGTDEDGAATGKPDRFMGVLVSYDEAMDEEIPEKPAEPVAPAPPREPEAPTESGDAEQDAAAQQEYEAAKASYEKAQREYEVEQKRYEEATQSYPQRVEEWEQSVVEHKQQRTQKVEELNARFIEYLYVIGDESFTKLHPEGASLFKAPEAEADDEADAPGP